MSLSLVRGQNRKQTLGHISFTLIRTSGLECGRMFARKFDQREYHCLGTQIITWQKFWLNCDKYTAIDWLDWHYLKSVQTGKVTTLSLQRYRTQKNAHFPGTTDNFDTHHSYFYNCSEMMTGESHDKSTFRQATVHRVLVQSLSTELTL